MQIADQQLRPEDAWKIAAGFSAVLVLPAIASSGGMPALTMVLAVLLAMYVYKVPSSVIYVAPLYLLAMNIFLPSSARFDINAASASEMYYWAVGILVITLAALPRVGWKAWTQTPRSLRCFLVVAIAASFYGAVRGNDLSYVLRQLFGSLLLGTYFMFAQHFGSEEEFCRTTRSFAIPFVAAFVMYYAWIFGEYGIHKEITSLGTQGAMLAIVFSGRRGWKWWIAAAVLMLPALLLVQRRDLSAFVLATVLILALRTKSIARRSLLGLATFLIVIFSLAPPLGERVMATMMGVSTIDRLLPEGARDTSSLADRGLQLVEAGAIVRRSPVFGYGMGSELSWLSAARGDIQQAYIDNGWAYVAIKMGLLGVVTFLWFTWDILKKMPGNSVGLSACVLSMLLLVMFTEPVFFQFTTTPLLGGVLGLLYAKRNAPVLCP